MKIKKGDNIIVIAGKDKGKSGTVLHVVPEKQKALVEGINIVKKHKKAEKRGTQGQIIEYPTPIDISNVALKGKEGKPVRVGFVFEGEGKDRKKVRVARPSGDKI